jgi:hypothetical protein
MRNITGPITPSTMTQVFEEGVEGGDGIEIGVLGVGVLWVGVLCARVTVSMSWKHP